MGKTYFITQLLNHYRDYHCMECGWMKKHTPYTVNICPNCGCKPEVA